MTDKQFANTPPLLLANPAISVIIPMYNAEKYIGECLDSLLAQTFQTFEVIVADDCSTDSSCEIIESYMPKFEGRLRLTHTETNSGGCAVPRNVGLPLARGKYVYFMDSDDALTQTGLEEMYTLAEEYDADVVYCERYYMSEGVGKDFIENMHVAKGRLQPPPYVEEPTLESSNLAERVKGILNDRFWFAAWLKLVRHDLLKEHNIFFPYVKPGEDDTWTHALIFFAKKFLRVPNMVYIRRMRDDSIIGTSKTPQQSLNFWFNPILLGLKELDKVMSQIEFFKENPQQHYAILEKQVQGKFRAGLRYAGQLTSTDVYETIKGEFGDKFGGQDILISALCSHIFGQDKALKETQKKLKHTEDVLKKVKDSIAAKESEMINRVENSMSYFLDLRQNGPEVSVVIPMYNAEKYIGELLDSLLAQTFPNFEAIVVDDCSTDNSVIVVESYESRFNGRLKLQKLEKNSGTGGSVPRNVGFKLVRGEYVLFVDADDYLSRFALETFYTAAKKYDADVVYTSAYNLLHRPDMSKVLKDGINQKLLKEKLEDKPTLTIDNPHKNLRQFDMEKSFNFPWTHFVRRDLLARNQIEFPEIPNGVDHLWALQVYCYAKRFLRIPNALYFYRRYQSESISTIKREPREQVSYWISTFTLWLKVLGDISNRIEILKDNPIYVLAAAERHFDWCLNRTGEARKILTDRDIYEILYNEFTKANVSSELTVPFFFNVINYQQKELKNRQENFLRFKEYYTARIDIKFMSTKGDFQIFSVSDDKANVWNPAWLQENGIGYQIQACTGRLTFIAKATVAGKISLALRGVDVRAPEDKSKRIPYWIDYTKLIINGKTILDDITPTWCGKPYKGTIDAKANEEIKIQVEWLPHRNDAIDVTALPPKVVTPPPKVVTPPPPKVVTPPPPKVVTPPPKVVTPPPPKVVTPPPPKVVTPPPPKVVTPPPLQFETARIDVKLLTRAMGDFQIISVSDDKANITKPRGLQDNGIGYMLTSSAGNLMFVAKATADGQINLKLRGLDIRAPKNKSKRIPKWIIYTKLIVNDKTIFDKLTPTWHDKPYVYKVEVKAGEELKIQLEWQPRKSEY